MTECAKEYEELGLKELKELIEADRKTEPQTELVNDSPILVKDLVDDEFNPYDEECMRCKHLKLKCEFVPTYCKFEPRDEPQTETQTETQNSNLAFEKDECAKEYEELGLKELKELIEADRKDEPHRDCFLCKWLGEVDVCGRCRNRNLFAEADTEPKPKDEPQTNMAVGKRSDATADKYNLYGKTTTDEPQTDGYISGEDFMKIFADCAWK